MSVGWVKQGVAWAVSALQAQTWQPRSSRAPALFQHQTRRLNMGPAGSSATSWVRKSIPPSSSHCFGMLQPRGTRGAQEPFVAPVPHSHSQLKTDPSGMSDASRRMSPDTAGAADVPASLLDAIVKSRPPASAASAAGSWPCGQNTSQNHPRTERQGRGRRQGISVKLAADQQTSC